MSRKVFKIRHRVTRLYSKGGMDVRPDGTGYGWSKKGKVWSSIGHLKSHLSQYNGPYWRKECSISEDWEIVEIEYVETACRTYSAKQLMEAKQTQNNPD